MSDASASGGKPAKTPSFTDNKTIGEIVAGKAAYQALKKKDCQQIRTNVRDREKAMGWLEWIATKDESWRNPWVINAQYQECKSLPAELDKRIYDGMRERLNDYDAGRVTMPPKDAVELRRTVGLIESRYNVGTIMTAPSGTMSAAEAEYLRVEGVRFGNNMTMALMPTSIPGIAGTRAMGGTEDQAAAGGQLSSMALGAGAFMAAVKGGAFRNTPTPQRGTRDTVNGAPLEPQVASPGRGTVVKQQGTMSASEHREWLKENGYRDVDGHVKAVDKTKPVELVELKKGDQFEMWVRDGGKPGSYGAPPGTDPSALGIDVAGRHLETFTVNTPFQVVRSTVADFAPGQYAGVGGTGGGTQYQLPSNYKDLTGK